MLKNSVVFLCDTRYADKYTAATKMDSSNMSNV